MSENTVFPHDQIGKWSETKLEIVKKYVRAYSIILSANPNLSHFYIDAFAGSGIHISKDTKNYVLGSPLNALLVDPGFEKYFFIEAKGKKASALEQAKCKFPNGDKASVYNGDCNAILLSEVFPQIQWEQYRRGLCLLDPYGVHLKWNVIETAAKMRTIDMFLNFPIMDINRNPLRRKVDSVTKSEIKRMNEFWGDDSWREQLYDSQPDLFGNEIKTKLGNSLIVSKFEERLKKVAGFKYVSHSIPMCNTNGAIIYYLVFASQKPVATDIVNEIFNKYRE